ncbi:MAG TPA: transketolase [Bacillales bacterium]|nr:transketolase [Bacillales bacterium]
MTESIDQLAVNTIRTLSIDSVERANSGHPGMPMGAAPMAYKLWTKFMDHNPSNPQWFNRDRFVLSAGHGSMLLYSMLHLFGYDLGIEDLKEFRQWGSKTPGHPEYGHTPGVDATTGPLGQGVAMSVGMAMAERHLAATYNRDGYPMVDHYTYAICGDGDLMEGVSAEAASLAGHLKLDRLIVMYDSNDISLDGDLNMSFSEKVGDRFESYGWQVLFVEDGNDLEAIDRAIAEAKADTERPAFIEIKTTIGYGAPNKSGKKDAHGAALGADEVKATKAFYKWDYEEDFHVPDEVQDHFRSFAKEGEKKEEEWNELFQKYEQAHPELAAQLKRAMNGELPNDWAEALPSYQAGEDKPATRAASSEAINAISKKIPELFGGSADLASSTKTLMKEDSDFDSEHYEGRNVWFGVREFAMAAASNGMALHGGVKPFAGTFFVFSDYLRPALRLSALMGLPVTYVFTHDSVAVGEDGPTHEPIEQLPSLRAMPGLSVIRPADGNETVAAWKVALESQNQPTALVLSRQGLPTLDGTAESASAGVARGAYVVSAAKGEPQVLLMGSGSEVHLLVEAQRMLADEGINVSVVSMPSWDRFEAQSDDYKEKVLPSGVKARLAVEMAASFGWHRYVGEKGDVLAIDHFGASAKGAKVVEAFGFTAENVAAKAKALVR